MGLSDLPFNVGQGDMLQTRGELPGKRVVIIVLLAVILLVEMTDTISDFGINSLIIQSNEELSRSTAKTAGTKTRKVRYTVRLHLPGIKMNQHLSDRSSPQYTKLSRSLSKDIQRLFANTVGKQSVSNIRFAEFKGRHREHGSVNEAGSAQKEIHLPTSPRPKTLSLSMSYSPRSIATHRPKQRGSRVSPFSRSTVAVGTPSKGTVQLPPNKSIITEKILDADENVLTATPSVTSAAIVTTSKQSTTLYQTSTPANEKVFNIAHITRMFKECYIRTASGDYNILIDKYLDAYTGLMGFFKFFGPVFSFAGKDIKDKLTQLRDLRKLDIEKSQNNYITFQSMFEYEHSPRGSQAEKEGTSANSWIHRGLKFISELIKASITTTSGKSLGDHAQELYTDILAPYHPWYVRTVAYLAILSFPTRSYLMEEMGIRDKAEDLQELADLSSAIDAVYEDVQNLYVKYSL